MPFPNPDMQHKILTRSGRLLDLVDPRPEDISIEDIAHGLSRQVRYGGHLGDYTVAQHCFAVARCIHDNWPGAPHHGLVEALRHALLHDASEAYIRDMPTPAKKLMPDYREVEARLEAAIYSRFGVSGDWADMVKEVDASLCGAEARLFLDGVRDDVEELFPSPTVPVEPSCIRTFWAPDRARAAYLALWASLGSADKTLNWVGHAYD